jgi:hypothetical protein
MDLNYLKNSFREIAWMIDPFYKGLMLMVYVGGPLTALLVLVMAYNSPDTTTMLAVIILLSMVVGFKLGPSPFFLVNCSWLYFRFDKFGLWLPILSYSMVLIILALQLAAKKSLTPSNE